MRRFFAKLFKLIGLIFFTIGEVIGGKTEDRVDFVNRLESMPEIREKWRIHFCDGCIHFY